MWLFVQFVNSNRKIKDFKEFWQKKKPFPKCLFWLVLSLGLKELRIRSHNTDKSRIKPDIFCIKAPSLREQRPPEQNHQTKGLRL